MQNQFQGFKEALDDEDDWEPNYTSQTMKNKNNSNIKEDKRNDIKSKDYNCLLFQESRTNTVEIKHNAKRNKLLI